MTVALGVGGDDVRVVLFCAADDEPHTAPLLQRLHAHGVHAELFPGIDEFPRRVGEVVDQSVGPGLFVLLESPRFDRGARARVEGLFSARRGPEHRLLVSELRIESESSVVERVRSECAALVMGVGASSSLSPESSAAARPRVRDVVNMDAVSTLRPPRRPTPLPMRDNTDEIDFEDLFPHERGEAEPEHAAQDTDPSAGEPGSGAPASTPRGRTLWLTYAAVAVGAALIAGVAVWAALAGPGAAGTESPATPRAAGVASDP